MYDLTHKYVHINIEGGNKRVASTIQAATKHRINKKLSYK